MTDRVFQVLAMGMIIAGAISLARRRGDVPAEGFLARTEPVAPDPRPES